MGICRSGNRAYSVCSTLACAGQGMNAQMCIGRERLHMRDGHSPPMYSSRRPQCYPASSDLVNMLCDTLYVWFTVATKLGKLDLNDVRGLPVVSPLRSRVLPRRPTRRYRLSPWCTSSITNSQGLSSGFSSSPLCACLCSHIARTPHGSGSPSARIRTVYFGSLPGRQVALRDRRNLGTLKSKRSY